MREKQYLCCTCLAKTEKEHNCPVGKCSNCGARHNILLCAKSREECVMNLKENNEDTSSGDDTDEEFIKELTL